MLRFAFRLLINIDRLSYHFVTHGQDPALCLYLEVKFCERLQNYELNYLRNYIRTFMDLSDKERYSISKVGKDTFVLTDADTLQTWQIEILRNSYKETEAEPDKNSSSTENK